MNTLLIITFARAGRQEERIANLVEWMGVLTRTIVLDPGAEPYVQLVAEAGENCSIAITGETLAGLWEAPAQRDRARRWITEHCSNCLVFGCSDVPRQSQAVSWLTGGAVAAVRRIEKEGEPGAETFSFPSSGKMFSRQFAGIDFTVPDAGERLGFFIEEGRAQVILSAGTAPVFAAVEAAAQLFLIAGGEALDIEASVSRSEGIEKNYHQIIPLLIWIRSCFPGNSWHCEQNTARFIIDDPLLKDNYGLLDYRELLAAMSGQCFGTSIAFIPWNYRRTSKKWVSELERKQANLSICVHGCDHSNREFATLDRDELTRKAGLAIERMIKHEKRTRMPFDSVMVFPQGKFSKSAISALRRTGYCAAVNTSCFPVDATSDDLRMRDFLRPAIMGFEGFPVFQRRYPKHMIDFAFDLFLGKPALIVEHHEYLGDRCERLKSFVGELKKIEPSLTWPTLSSQLTRSCLMRDQSDHSVVVHFFTRLFHLKNEQTCRRQFLLEKEEPDPSVVRAVLVDGKEVPFRFTDKLLYLDIELASHQEARVEILDQWQANFVARNPGAMYYAGIFLRRGLSEIRDNILAKRPGMLKVAKKVARKLKATGD